MDTHMLFGLNEEELKKKISEMEVKPIVKEAVDHPQHYNRKGAMECIEEMRLIFGDYETAIFCKLNAYKYRYRAGSKGNAEEDLRKSDWYIKKYKELTVGEETIFDKLAKAFVCENEDDEEVK